MQTVARQLADELEIDYQPYIGDSLYLWIQEANSKRRRAWREGSVDTWQHRSLIWMQLGKRPGMEGIDLQEVSESEPPKGERGGG